MTFIQKIAFNGKHILKAVASFFLWGLGQLFNRQYLKALFFFFFMVALVLVELVSGKYGVTIDPYASIPGREFSTTFATSFRSYYNLQVATSNFSPYSYTSLDGTQYPVSEVFTDDDYTMDTLREYISADLLNQNPVRYVDVLLNHSAVTTARWNPRTEDLYTSDSADVPVIADLEQVAIKRVLYQDPSTLDFYRAFTRVVNGVNTTTYINISNENDIIDSITGFTVFDHLGNIFTNATRTSVYEEVRIDGVTTFINLLDRSEQLNALVNRQAVAIKGPVYVVKPTSTHPRKVYQFFNPDLIYQDSGYVGFVPTRFTTLFATFLNNEFNKAGTQMRPEDVQNLLMRIYFDTHPVEKAAFEVDFNNFFYDQAGVFLRGYWGVITLGERKSFETYAYGSLKAAVAPSIPVLDSISLMAHVSTQVLLEGLIGVILSFFFFIFWFWSILDAYRVSKARSENEPVLDTKNYFKQVWENGFEYIVLSPALFVLAFISIMPIMFGFLIAFTSISGNKSMIENFDWVGFQNFVDLFDFSSTLGSTFGIAFWRVLGWTIVWAIFSTATVFFGGFFQAVIINNDHVPLKKFWRTVLILPWAMPALLSQMVFSVMFDEKGFINEVLKSVGAYDFFINLGWLGTTDNPLDFTQLVGIDKLFYMGPDNIQWFNNPFNPTFVRITLVVVNIWLGFPYFMALMSGIMTSIDKSLYEAAKIDGATRFQLFRFLTFPLVMYSTAPILIMTFSGNFNNFGVIYFITQGGPNEGRSDLGYAGDTDILISWMYNLTVTYSIYNMASVFSVLIFIFVGSVTAYNLSKTRAFKED